LKLWPNSYTWYPVTYFPSLAHYHRCSFLLKRELTLHVVCLLTYTQIATVFLYFLIDQNQPYHIDYIVCAGEGTTSEKESKREPRAMKCSSTVGIFRGLFYFRRKQSCNYKSYDVNLLLKEFSSFCRSRAPNNWA
jgi:hypothetical protein